MIGMDELRHGIGSATYVDELCTTFLTIVDAIKLHRGLQHPVASASYHRRGKRRNSVTAS